MVQDDLKNMPDTELAKRVIYYIDEIEAIKGLIREYNKRAAQARYRELKAALRADADYLSLVRNDKCGSVLYLHTISMMLRECSCHLRARVNDDLEAISHSLYEARWDLIFHHSREEWAKIASGELVIE